MPQTNVNIRMDSELKKDFELFCREIGLTVTAAINVYVKKVVEEQRIPFELALKKPNAGTILAFKEAEQALTSGNYKSYSSLREAVEEMEDNDEL